MDVSDGFVQDAQALLAASNVGADVEVSRLPVDPEVSRAYASPKRALRAALVGGEDYELLLGVPRSAPVPSSGLARNSGSGAGRRSSRARPGLRFLDAEGRVLPLQESGFDHFASRRRS